MLPHKDGTFRCVDLEPIQRGADIRGAIPIWDEAAGELWFAGLLVKVFRRAAADQRTILCAFQELGWPARIDDPLPPKRGKSRHRRLHDAINNLHRRMLHSVLRFRGDGTGEGILWEPRLPVENTGLSPIPINDTRSTPIDTPDTAYDTR